MNERYSEILLDSNVPFIVATIIGLIVLIPIIVVLYIKNRKNDDTKDFKFLFITFIIVFSVVFAWWITFTCNTVSDVKNQAYIVYEGEFYVENPRNSKIKLLDGSNTKLEYDYFEVYLSGYHKGKIVYSQKTKIALEIIEYSD